MNILLIDDKKSLAAALHFYDGKYTLSLGKNDLFHYARTYDSAIKQMQAIEWDAILLDFDLGNEFGDEGELKTGDDILDWLEHNVRHMPLYIFVVSLNSVGRQRLMFKLAEFKAKGWIKDYD